MASFKLTAPLRSAVMMQTLSGKQPQRPDRQALVGTGQQMLSTPLRKRRLRASLGAPLNAGD